MREISCTLEVSDDGKEFLLHLPRAPIEESGAVLVQARLTAQESRVLELIQHGKANKEIAAELNCAIRTVKFHVSNLLRKLSVTTRYDIPRASTS